MENVLIISSAITERCGTIFSKAVNPMITLVKAFFFSNYTGWLGLMERKESINGAGAAQDGAYPDTLEHEFFFRALKMAIEDPGPSFLDREIAGGGMTEGSASRPTVQDFERGISSQEEKMFMEVF